MYNINPTDRKTLRFTQLTSIVLWQPDETFELDEILASQHLDPAWPFALSSVKYHCKWSAQNPTADSFSTKALYETSESPCQEHASSRGNENDFSAENKKYINQGKEQVKTGKNS